jgi:outer membrane protein assembly factor BamB
MTKLFPYVALLLIFAGFASAPAQTGFALSSWPTSRHDSYLTARAQVAGPAKPQLKWTLNLASGKLGSPVLAADGTIYVPGNVNDTLYAVTADGRLQWSFTGKKLVDEQFVAPVVVDRSGMIYFGSTQNIFYAVNPDGSLRWSLALGGPIRYSANLGNNGTIYVAANDFRLYALTPNGNIQWSVSLEQRPGNAPAIASDGTIYVVADDFLKGYAPNGTRRLNVSCVDMGLLYGLVVDGFELIYVSGLESNHVRAISNSGATRWEYKFPASFGAPQLPALGKDGALYFSSVKTGELFALNHNGTKRWSYSQSSAPYLTELAIDDSNNVYIVSDEHGLTSVSADGRLRWTLPDVHCQFSPGFGADGTLYVATDKKLYAIGARTPKLMVDLAALDWGQVCVGNTWTLALKISNPGNADLQVSDLAVSNLAFQVEPKNFVLPAGGEQIVQIKFTPADFISYTGTLAVNSNAGNVIVSLKGAGIGATISALTAALQFGDVIIGRTASQLAQILNAGACELRIDSVKTSGVFAVETAAMPKILTPGDTAKFVVRFSPANVDAQRASLLIYNNDAQNNPLVVPLWGTGVASLPEIEVAPLALEFGKVCQESQLYTVVANLGYITLRVDSLVFSNSAFSTNHARAFTVAPGARDTIDVRYKPVAGAESNGALAIFSNDADEKSVPVQMHGAGGVPGIAGLNEIDFGVVDVQTCAGLANSATRTHVIRNDGSCGLKIDSLSAAGVFSILSFTAAQLIPAGDSLSVSLKFTPTAAGEQNGALRIVSNDPNTRVAVVKLRGLGVAAPDIAVQTDALNFGAVPVGNAKTLQLNIRNLGEANLAVTNLAVSSSLFNAMAGQFTLTCKKDSTVVIAFSPDSMGVFTATLTIASNDPDEGTVKILLQGQGTPVAQAIIATDASEYRFPAICLGSRDSLRAVVTNKGSAALQVDSLRVQSHRQVFRTAGAGFTLAAQQSKTLTVYFKPVSRAEYAATLQIFSNAANGRDFKVGLHGRGSAPEISGLGQIAFAPTRLDSARREAYLVNNIGDCDLAVTSVKIEGVDASDFKVLDAGAAIIAPQSVSRVTVEFKPSAANTREGKLVIISSDPVRSRFEVALNGSGSGLPGKLAGPNFIDFGVACFDEVVARECVLTNAGQSELKITRLFAIDGEFFKIVGALQLPATLRPQEAAKIPLLFSTRKAGALNDTLLVQTDLATSATYRVVLKGVGRDDMARLNVSHQALNFNGHLDEPKTEIVAITNVGCGRLAISQVELARKLRVFSIHPERPLPVTLENMQSLNVAVSFKGDDFRAFADSMYIYCLDWQQKQERMSVSLSGQVTDGAPCLQAATTLDFGETDIGKAISNKLVVTNCSSGGRIVVRAIQPRSGNFTVLQDSLLIFPNNPQSFDVTFAPRRHGEISDTLRLVYYAPDEPGLRQTQNVVLRGAATGHRAYARPNAFTPNGDSMNDQAKIYFPGYNPESVVLRVYNLRGLEVRLLRPESRGEFVSWDGRDDRGELQMPGAYLWLLENNGKKVGSGQIALIR